MSSPCPTTAQSSRVSFDGVQCVFPKCISVELEVELEITESPLDIQGAYICTELCRSGPCSLYILLLAHSISLVLVIPAFPRAAD